MPSPVSESQKMLTNPSSNLILPLKATKYLSKIIIWGGKLSYIPYTWNKKTNRAEYKNGRSTRRMYFFQLSLVFLYQMYLVYKCVTILRSPVEKVQRKIRTSYMTFIYIICNVQHLATVKQYGQQHLLINTLMDVTQKFNAENGPIKIRGKNKVYRVMRMLSFATLVGCSNGIGVFLAPKSPTLLTSLFENPRDLPLVVKLAIATLQIAINLFHFYPVTFYSSVLFYFVSTVVPVIHRMRCAITIKRIQSSQDLHADALLKCYSELRILQNNFNNCFGLWTIGMEIFSIVLITLNMFQAVVFQSLRAFVLGFTSGICLIFVYSEFSQVHETATGTLGTWKIIVNPLWFVKYRRSCKPTSVTLGSFYFADKFLPLTILSIIFSNAANLIVTFKTD